MSNIKHPYLESKSKILRVQKAPIEHPDNIKRQTHLYCSNCNYCQSDYNIDICENCKVNINSNNSHCAGSRTNASNLSLDKLLYTLYIPEKCQLPRYLAD
jgi:hypothetical protein